MLCRLVSAAGQWFPATFLLCAAAAITAPAQTLTTLANFTQGDGYPAAALVQGTDGNFYGATEGSTLGEVCTQQHSPGCGTIYKIIPAGAPIILYRFCSQPNCADGAAPFAGLLQATNGKFYGTTQHSGDLSCGANVPGCGTVFEITPGGGLTTLHTFQGADGAWPFGTLIQATDGHLYGTTLEGGSYTNPCLRRFHRGLRYRLQNDPRRRANHVLQASVQPGDCSAYEPQAALLQATNGDFYTTTSLPNGDVVKLTPQADLTVLHKFDRNDGLHLMAPLIQATDGNFYGTAPEWPVTTR